MKSGLRTLLLVGLAAHTLGYRRYLMALPNPTGVPCPPDQDCWGGPCGAFGHTNCRTGGTNNFGGGFGDEWTASLCEMDSDGDGKTNGDELGDPCCVWSYGDSPRYTTDLSSPGHATGVTSRPSCKLDGAPSATLSVASVAAQVGGATVAVPKLTWSTSSCICSFQLTYAVNGGQSTTIKVDPDTTEFVLCPTGLSAGDSVTATLTPTNLASTGSTVSQTITVPASTSGLTAATCSSMTNYVAPTIMSRSAPSEPVLYIPVTIAVALICFVVLLLSRNASESWVRLHKAFRRPLGRLRPYVPRAGASACVRLWRWTMLALASLTAAEVGALVLVLAVVVVTGIDWNTEYGDIPYPYGAKVAWARAVGMLAVPLFSFAILPVSKFSVWPRLIGVPMERALKVHKWMGAAAMATTFLHGFAMAVAYAVDSKPGLSLLLESKFNVSVLPATGGLVLAIVVAVGSLPVVRRAAYRFFWYTHLLVFPMTFLFVLHIPILALAMGVGLVMVVVDVLAVVADLVLRPTRLTKARLITPTHGVVAAVEPGNSATSTAGADESAGTAVAEQGKGDSYVHLSLRKRHMQHKPGQYMYLFVPSISLLPHPFSIASAPPASVEGDAGASEEESSTRCCGRFLLGALSLVTDSVAPGVEGEAEVVLKCTRPGSFTAKLGAAIREGRLGAKGCRVYTFGCFGVPSVPLETAPYTVLFAGGVGATPMVSLWAWRAKQALALAKAESSGKSKVPARPGATPKTPVTLEMMQKPVASPAAYGQMAATPVPAGDASPRTPAAMDAVQEPWTSATAYAHMAATPVPAGGEAKVDDGEGADGKESARGGMTESAPDMVRATVADQWSELVVSFRGTALAQALAPMLADGLYAATAVPGQAFSAILNLHDTKAPTTASNVPLGYVRHKGTVVPVGSVPGGSSRPQASEDGTLDGLDGGAWATVLHALGGRLIPGRPDVVGTLKAAALRVKSSAPKKTRPLLMVGVCGPTALIVSVFDGAKQVERETGVTVHVHSEVFYF